MSSALSTAAKKVQLYAIENSDTYPTTLTQVNIQGSDQPNTTTYRYTANNTTTPKTYCITALNGTTRAYLSNTTTSPQTGSCPGHEDDSNYVTNYMTNPSFEQPIVIDNDEDEDVINGTWIAEGGVSIERSTESARTGRYALKITTPPSNPRQGGAAYCITIAKGNRYAIRIWSRADQVFTSSTINFGLSGAGGWNFSGPMGESTTWTTSNTFATGDAMTNNACITIGFSSSTPLSRHFYIDDIQVLKITSPSYIPSTTPYRDGDSAGWIWNGPPGNSTSTGPLN